MDNRKDRLPQSVLPKMAYDLVHGFFDNHKLKQHNKKNNSNYCQKKGEVVVTTEADEDESDAYIARCCVCRRVYYDTYPKYRIGRRLARSSSYDDFIEDHSFRDGILAVFGIVFFASCFGVLINVGFVRFEKRLEQADATYVYKDGEKATCWVYIENDDIDKRVKRKCEVIQKTDVGTYLVEYRGKEGKIVQTDERALDMQPK